MLGRLILKTILVICAITALISSMARAESSDNLSLAQIRDLQASTMEDLNDSQYSNEQKYDLILQQKYLAETSLRQLILAGRANPADMANPNSSLARAFQTADGLVVLAQLKLENGRFTEASCIEAKAMLRLGALEAESGRADLNRKDQQILHTLTNLCR